MRSKKELYKIILDEFKKHSSLKFICNAIIDSHYKYSLISEKEMKYLLEDLHNNFPSKSQHSEFINEYFNKNNPYASWWRNINNPEAKTIRITFLEKLIGMNE